MPAKTYLNDLVSLSVLPAGWAPGDSFRRLKMASLFFTSLALGAEAERGLVSPAPPTPAKSGWGRRGRAGATYSFIVCRL